MHGKETSAQVPIADMSNARNPQNVFWSYNNAKNGFVVEAQEDIKAGDQIF